MCCFQSNKFINAPLKELLLKTLPESRLITLHLCCLLLANSKNSKYMCSFF